MVIHSNPAPFWTLLHERSSEPEWMDDMSMEREPLENNLRELEVLNRYLGGHRSLLRVFQRALRFMPRGTLRLVDVGCGGGDGLRLLDRWCAAQGLSVDLVGLDLNPTVLEMARNWSRNHPRIRYVQGDAFGGALAELCPDITTATLFCHHFPSSVLPHKLRTLLAASRALVISDLHRHVLSHAAFHLLARAARLSPMTRHDGAISIRRGFKRRELERLLASLDARHVSINWALAFRYEALLVR